MPFAERKLIDSIRRKVGRRRSGEVFAGIGDDAAVLGIQPGSELLVTTDLTIEGVHFRRDWHAPAVVGHRALARGLSDIAAMGGAPVAVFLSLALPRKIPQRWVDSFLNGFSQLAGKYDVTLAGGDTSSSISGVVADVIVLGKVPKGTAILRSGARPGDVICVTGALGAPVVLLRRLGSGKKGLRDQGLLPEPRLTVGRWLRERRLPTAMIDISDGLSTDLAHICQESRVGAALMENAIPRASGASLEEALHGGEDYELLFTIPAKKNIPLEVGGVAVSAIGEIVRSPSREIRILSLGKWKRLPQKGWQHFA